MVTWKFLALYAPLLISAVDLQTFTIFVTRSEVNAEVGDTVTLSVRPSSPVVSGFWKFGSSSIVTWTVEGSYLNVAYTKRKVNLLLNTSLLMWSVALADSGVYRVTMDSRTGQEAIANITLNVLPKPVPFTISIEGREVNATAGDTVRLKVTPSEDVKSGRWQVGGADVARWDGHVQEIGADYGRRATLFDGASLQLMSAKVSDTGRYSVTMTTDSGDTATANIQLNVFKESEPLKVSTKLSTINAETEADVLLSVTMSGEVQSGNWTFNGWWLFYWHPSKNNASYYQDIDLLPNGSLLLNSLSFDMEGIYIITLMSPTGVQATANITVNVFTSGKVCTAYNIILALLSLLALALILISAVYIQTNHMKHDLETFDALVALCKGYRLCFSCITVVTLCLISICAAMVHKDSCVLGQRPALDFVAK